MIRDFSGHILFSGISQFVSTHQAAYDPLFNYQDLVLNYIFICHTGTEGGSVAATLSPASELESLIERLERVTTRLERLPLLRRTPPCSPAPSPASAPSPPPLDFVDTDEMSVNGYQDLVQVSRHYPARLSYEPKMT